MVITLLLIGIDMYSSTELRRDILHAVSILCCQLPTEYEAEGTVRGHSVLSPYLRDLTSPRKLLFLRGC